MRERVVFFKCNHILISRTRRESTNPTDALLPIPIFLILSDGDDIDLTYLLSYVVVSSRSYIVQSHRV